MQYELPSFLVGLLIQLMLMDKTVKDETDIEFQFEISPRTED